MSDQWKLSAWNTEDKEISKPGFDLWSVHTDVTDHTASTDALEVRIYSTGERDRDEEQ